MVVEIKETIRGFLKSRWLVFVASMWIQSCSGIGYMFGSVSPYIKTSMGYNQRQIAVLGVAKDLGDSIGFVAGFLCEVLPIWGILLIGVVQNFVGYGLVWLIVTGTLPHLPLWMLCISIFVGTNGETYFNTGVLVSCVQNFPKSRGPVVGILKGFAGLSGAILSLIYAMINFSNKSGLIFMIAVGPSMVIFALMFIVRPVGGHRQIRSSDSLSFFFVYADCLLLAAYLLGVLILNDLADPNHKIITLLTILLFIILLLPIFIPIQLLFSSDQKSPQEESLICSSPRNEVIFSEVEDEKTLEIDSLPELDRRKRMAHLQSKLFQAAAEGAVRLKRQRKGPRRGEDFTLRQALVKADFWLIFFSLVLASGSGLTVIDNLGQICQSLGYNDTSIYVSMISILNFLGRVGGGYFSEIIVRKYNYPRAIAMAVVQVIMAMGLFYYSMGWPSEIYILTISTGLGYGAHWAIVPAAASELFGLKSFGALYNFLTLASPVGSLVFSGVIASGIYDYYAAKQHNPLSDDDASSCMGIICYSLTFGILSGLCIIAVLLSSILVYRTKIVYANLRN